MSQSQVSAAVRGILMVQSQETMFVTEQVKVLAFIVGCKAARCTCRLGAARCTAGCAAVHRAGVPRCTAGCAAVQVCRGAGALTCSHRAALCRAHLHTAVHPAQHPHPRPKEAGATRGHQPGPGATRRLVLWSRLYDRKWLEQALNMPTWSGM